MIGLCVLFVPLAFATTSADINPLYSRSFSSYLSIQELLFDARLFIALLLGFLCGLTHGIGPKNIAISTKTYTAVCLGAAAFSTVLTHVYVLANQPHSLSGLGSIVQGIGFVCAAVIFKQGSIVRGLSTAASLWTCAAVGMACGTANYGVAVFVTATLCVFHFIPNGQNQREEKT